MTTTQQGRRFDVFTIHEYMHERQLKNSWTRIGSAFENVDGSWNLRLRALPLVNPKTGLAELHMREPRPLPADAQTDGERTGFENYTPPDNLI